MIMTNSNKIQSPSVSIIVPIYKVLEQFLRHSIESCIGQTLKDIEIILVDDGSPDDCGKICDEYAQKDARVKVIHKVNGGLVSARNAGYEAVTGEWHMYLDGDDWIDVDTCEAVLEYVNKYQDIDIVFWKCIQELGDKSIKGKWEWPCEEQEHLYTNDECIELARNTLVYKSGIATAYNKLIRTDYARQYAIKHDDRLKQGAEGMEFSLRAFYYAKTALYVNAYWNHYLFNSDSISKKIDEKNTKYLTDCLQVIEEVTNGFVRKNEFRQALYQRTVYILLAIAMSTYFHPSNPENLYIRTKKYSDVINSYNLYSASIRHASTEGMDKQRKIALLFIKLRMYFMLDVFGKAKQYFLKKGKYNY